MCPYMKKRESGKISKYKEKKLEKNKNSTFFKNFLNFPNFTFFYSKKKQKIERPEEKRPI